MTNNNTFERVVVHIPVGTTLTASNGVFLFKSELTDEYHGCKKIKYLGDGRWVRLGDYIKMDIDEVEVRK